MRASTEPPAVGLIGAQPFERSVPEALPGALPVLHLHDEHRLDPIFVTAAPVKPRSPEERDDPLSSACRA